MKLRNKEEISIVDKLSHLAMWFAAKLQALCQDEQGSARSWTLSLGLFVVTLLVIVVLIFLMPDTVKLVWRKFIFKLLRTLRL